MQSRAHLKTNHGAVVPALAFPRNTAQKWTLPNGLTIIVQEDRSAPVASVQAWCATGSIHEDEHLGAGLSHILEHMLFKGTRTRSTNEIAQKIQDIGGYINAYTSFDRTVFWIDLPRDGVGAALEILSDAMMNSTLPEEEYAKEQEVIRREFAMGSDDPERTLTQLLFTTAYQEHPYKLPVIGVLDIYNQLTQQEVLDYYKRRYPPNNLTFVVAGDVKAEEVREKLAQLFEKNPARSLRPIYLPPEPAQRGRRETHQEFPSELTHYALAWHVPEITHPDVPALDLLSVILGEGRSSRLYRKLREERGLVFAIETFSYTPGEPGIWGAAATMNPSQRSAAQEAILQEVEDICRHGVSEAELTKAKKIALAGELDGLTTMRGQASDLGTNWFLTRNLNFSREYLDKVQQVTSAEVQRVAAQYLTDENLTIVSLNPPGSISSRNGEAKATTVGEVQKFELSNGLRLLVREDGRLPLVAISAVFRCGLLSEDAANNGITRLTAKCLLKGTKSRAGEQIAGELEAVGGEIASRAGNNTLAVNVDVTRPDLALAVEILADVLLNASLPEAAIAREKEVQLAKIKAEDEQPAALAKNILRAALFPRHPLGLRLAGTAESVTRLSRRELLEFRDRYLVARNGVISIFGNVKAEEVRQLLEEKLGGMKPGELALTDAPSTPQLTEKKRIETSLARAQAVVVIGFRSADVMGEDRYPLELIDEASSDLGSRFFICIRERMGLAYFVGASQVQALVPGLFAFYVGTDPNQLELVEKAFLDELNKLAQEGLTPVELRRAKQKLIGQQQIENQSNDRFAYMAGLDELYGLGFDHYRELESKVNAVTVEDVKRVARKYFAEQPYVLSIVRPPTKVTK